MKILIRFAAAALAAAIFCVFPLPAQSAASGECEKVGLFKNFKPAKTELGKFKELFRMFELTRDDSYYQGVKILNDGLTFKADVAGTELSVVLFQYEKENGKLYYISRRGKELQPAGEEERLKGCFTALVKRAVENNFKDHNFRLAEVAGKYLGIPPKELEETLKRDTGYGVTLGEALKLQPMERKDFVPKTLYVGSISAEGVLAAAYLNSGVVLYGPQAALWDHIVGEPQILQHELIHRNPKLQSIPTAWQFDVEFFASLGPFLDENSSVLDFLNHGYLKTIRDMAKVYFGLDTARARKEIITRDYSRRIVVDEKKFNEYSALIKKAAAELKRASVERILPEFYADLPFWLAVNRKFNDPSAAFKVLMARDYEPTLLGGYEQTAAWIEQNRELIKKITRDALRRLKAKEKTEPPANEEVLLMKFLGIDEKQLEAIKKHLREENTAGKEIREDILRILRENALSRKGEKQ